MLEAAKIFKLYDQSVLMPLDIYSPDVYKTDFKVFSGSRLLISIYNKTINPGSNINLSVLNSFSLDEGVIWEESLNDSFNDQGWSKRIITDFNKFFQIKLQVVGGPVELMLGISLFDNSDAVAVENGELIDRLNKLVPEIYDDVEVLTLTPGNQPIDIDFRRKGKTIRTIKITYLNEVFIRARIV